MEEKGGGLEQKMERVFHKMYTSYEEIEDAGQPFIVDGDSLLLDALSSPSLDWAYGPHLLQIFFQLEQRLERLLQSNRRYTLVYFDVLRAIWRRPSHALARELFIKHVSTKCAETNGYLKVQTFTDWESKEFGNFVSSAHPSFALTSPGGGVVSRLLSPNSATLLKRLTAHLLANGIRVVRGCQFNVSNTRLRGFQQLARDSAISDYVALLPLPPLPPPRYAGILNNLKTRDGEVQKPQALPHGWMIEDAQKGLGSEGAPKSFVVAVVGLAAYWKALLHHRHYARQGGEGSAEENAIQHHLLAKAENEAEEMWSSVLASQDRSAALFKDADDDSDQDEWDGRGLGGEGRDATKTAQGQDDGKRQDGETEGGEEEGEAQIVDEEAEEEAHRRAMGLGGAEEEKGDANIDEGGWDDDNNGDELENWEDFSEEEEEGEERGGNEEQNEEQNGGDGGDDDELDDWEAAADEIEEKGDGKGDDTATTGAGDTEGKKEDGGGGGADCADVQAAAERAARRGVDLLVWKAASEAALAVVDARIDQEMMAKTLLLSVVLARHLTLQDRIRRLPVPKGGGLFKPLAAPVRESSSPPSSSSPSAPLESPRVFLELYAAHLVAMTAGSDKKSTATATEAFLHVVDGALFHRTLALVLAAGVSSENNDGSAIASAADIGLPDSMSASLSSLWKVFRTLIQNTKGNEKDSQQQGGGGEVSLSESFFPLEVSSPVFPAGKEGSPSSAAAVLFSQSLATLQKSRNGKLVAKEEDPIPAPPLQPVEEAAIVDYILADSEKKALSRYVAPRRSTGAKGVGEKKKKKSEEEAKELYWMPPDPLKEGGEELVEAEEAAMAQKRRKQLLERKERARQGRGLARLDVAKSGKNGERNDKLGGGGQGIVVSGTSLSSPSSREAKMLVEQERQKYLLFMTKYAQSLSGTRLVLRDVIVAKSSNGDSGSNEDEAKGGGGAKWQGSSGKKKNKGGWNPGGKKGKKKGRKGGGGGGGEKASGKAMREQIIAGVDARKREEIKQNVVSYVAAARRIPLALRQTVEEKRRKEDEALGVTFGGPDADGGEEGEDGEKKKKQQQGSMISLVALEKRISSLDERLVDISDPHVIPGLLVLLDWCVLAWCEQQHPGTSFKLPSPDADNDEEEEEEEEEEDGVEEKKKEDGKEAKTKAARSPPSDVEMERAVRVFQMAFDVFRRFKSELTMPQLGRVLYALLVIGFLEQAKRLLQDYIALHKLDAKDVAKKQAAAKVLPIAPEGALGDGDEYLEQALRMLTALGVKVLRPRNEGLAEGEEEEEEDSDEDEDHDDDDDDDDDDDEGQKKGKGLSRKEREALAKRARMQKSEAQRRFRHLAVDSHRIPLSPERFQLTYAGPKMVRDVQSAPDPRVSGFYPDKWQREMLDIVDRRASALIVAPTSSGKTFASFYAMKKILTHNKQSKPTTTGLLAGPLIIVYVCPTTALVSQVAASVYRRYGAVFGVLTPGVAYKTETCEVLVTLPQCLETIMLAPEREPWVARVKYVIYDEVHSLDGEDGGPWERLLAAFPAPFLALSATVGNPHAFHSWLQQARQRTAKLGTPNFDQERAAADGGSSSSTTPPSNKRGKKGGGRKGGRRGGRGDNNGGEESASSSSSSPFPTDNPEVALIVHTKRWADLEKAVYLPAFERDRLLLSYKHGIVSPKTNAERMLLKQAGKRAPKLLPSGLLPFHPLAAVAFGAAHDFAERRDGGGAGDKENGETASSSNSGSTIAIPKTMEFSPRDSIVLYDHMCQSARGGASSSGSSEVAALKGLRPLEPSAYFRAKAYIGRDAAHEYGEKIKTAFGVWAEKLMSGTGNTRGGGEGRGPAELVLDQLAAPVRDRLGAISERKESIASRHFVSRYVLPLFVDLAREDKLPCVAFCLDPNLCEALALRIVETLERLEKAASEREGGEAEKRRVTKMALKASKLVKQMQNRRRNKKEKTLSGQQKKQLTHDQQARLHDARVAEQQRADAARIAASMLDQDELDLQMDVDPRFSFVPDNDRISREDLDFWMKRLRDATGWPNDHPLLRALWRGVGVHHEGLPRSYKDLVETMFRGKHIKVVIATKTLAVGVNMPSRTCAFLGDSPLLTPLAFRQMAGRAGRRGHDDVGYVAFLGVPMQKVASLMTSPLTSLRGRYAAADTSLALRMALFQSYARDRKRATQLVSNILLTPPLSLPGAHIKSQQARVSFRFSLEQLLRQGLADPKSRPVGLAGVAASLHAAGGAGSSMAFVSLMRSGTLRRVCGGPKRFKLNPDGSARRLMFVLCHLFLRVPFPADVRRSNFKRSSSTVLLAPLPRRVASEIRAIDTETLGLAADSFSAFLSMVPTSSLREGKGNDGGDAGGSAINGETVGAKDNQQLGEKQQPSAAHTTSSNGRNNKKGAKQKKLSKRERKRLEALARLQKNSSTSSSSSSSSSISNSGHQQQQRRQEGNSMNGTPPAAACSSSSSTGGSSSSFSPALKTVQYGCLPISALPAAPPAKGKKPEEEKTTQDGAEGSGQGGASLLSQLSAGTAAIPHESSRSELAGHVPAPSLSGGDGGAVFLSAMEAVDSAGFGVVCTYDSLGVVGGGPGATPARVLGKEEKGGAAAAEAAGKGDDCCWDGPLLNAYALDFLKHGQLATIVKDNRVAAGRAWILLRDWDLLLTRLAAAINGMAGAPDYAPTFSFLACRFRQKFKTLSAQG